MVLERTRLLPFHGFGRRGCARLALCSILCSVPSALPAQSVPPQIEPPTREEVTRPVAPAQPPKSRLEVEGGIAKPPCALEGAQFRSVHFVLRGAEFDGLEGLTRSDLASTYSDRMGQDVPISTVCEIRDRATATLRNAGYIAAVQVPEQRIEGGIIHFRVLMARLTQVRVRGEARGAETVLAAYLSHLTKRPLFNRFEAERYLLLASDLPGYTVRLTLRPAGTAPGDVIGDVTVLRLPAYVDSVVQNSGSRDLGQWGGLVRGQLFGLTGLGDRTIISAFTTSDFHKQQTILIGHDMRIGPEGLTLGGTFAYSWSRPSVPDAHVLAHTLLGTLELGFPFVRREATTLRGSAGIDIINQDVKFDGAPLTRDRLRVAFLRFGLDATARNFGPQYSKSEPPWRFTTLFEV
ncbi:MAG TPA: POTRA domain-containing protein, partial [Sphingomicrobium sp.]|nr:POTRA domain-containing protein [Sphingomicrobium sp.]